MIGVVPSVPDTFWKSCFSVSVPCGVCQVPSTFAGTIQSSTVHHERAVGTRFGVVGRPALHAERVRDDAAARREVEELRCAAASCCSAAGRAPSRSPSRCRPRTCRPARNSLCPATPASAALRFDSSTMSGLYSTPSAVRAALRRGDDVAAVARAEVHDVVLRRDFRDVEHLLDQSPEASAPRRRPCLPGRRRARTAVACCCAAALVARKAARCKRRYHATRVDCIVMHQSLQRMARDMPTIQRTISWPAMQEGRPIAAVQTCEAACGKIGAWRARRWY